jgi:hypothetical protein
MPSEILVIGRGDPQPWLLTSDLNIMARDTHR